MSCTHVYNSTVSTTYRFRLNLQALTIPRWLSSAYCQRVEVNLKPHQTTCYLLPRIPRWNMSAKQIRNDICRWSKNLSWDPHKTSKSEFFHVLRINATQLSFSLKHSLHLAESYLTSPWCTLNPDVILLPHRRTFTCSAPERWNIREFLFSQSFLSSGISIK